MTQITINTLNEILKIAGIAPQVLKVVSTADADKKVINKDGSIFVGLKPERMKGSKFVLSETSRPGTLFSDLNRYLSTHFSKHLSKIRQSNESDLFSFLGNDKEIAFVDLDSNKGPDRLLYHYPQGWKILNLQDKSIPTPTLIQLCLLLNKSPKNEIQRRNHTWLRTQLQNLDWKDLGFKGVKGSDFNEKQYGFRAETRSLGIFFPDPSHPVHLKGHPEIQVPWSDPYLLSEWRSFLKKAGVEIHSDSHDNEYSYEGLRLFAEKKTAAGVRFTFYSPNGEIKHQLIFPEERQPDIQIRHMQGPTPTTENSKKSLYRILIDSHAVEVEVHFPNGTSKADRQQKIKNIVKAFEKIPLCFLKPLLTETGNEKPIRFVLSNKLIAEKLDIEKRYQLNGHYDVIHNHIWINTEPKEGFNSEITLIHEIGHALGDFLISQDNGRSITHPLSSFLRSYYLFKLSTIFTPDELKAYERLVVERRVLAENHASKKALEPIAQKLAPYQDKLMNFSTTYAMEGLSIEEQMRQPYEDFADTFAWFVLCLQGFNSLKEFTHNRMHVSEDPMARLFGLLYLMQKYQVSSVGNVEIDQVFSKASFQEVLNHSFKIQKSYVKALKDRGFPVDLPSARPGLTLPLHLGFDYFFLPKKIGASNPITASIELGAGYQNDFLGLGLSLTYGVGSIQGQPFKTLEERIWARFSSEDRLPLSLTVSPSLGVRHFIASKTYHVPAVGIAGGFEFFEGSFALQLQGGFYPAASLSGSIGASVVLDLPILLRHLKE